MALVVYPFGGSGITLDVCRSPDRRCLFCLSLHCGDIDINKRLEIIIGAKDDYIYVFDAEGKFKQKIIQCFENMLDDPEPIIRKMVIKSFECLCGGH